MCNNPVSGIFRYQKHDIVLRTAHSLSMNVQLNRQVGTPPNHLAFIAKNQAIRLPRSSQVERMQLVLFIIFIFFPCRCATVRLDDTTKAQHMFAIGYFVGEHSTSLRLVADLEFVPFAGVNCELWWVQANIDFVRRINLDWRRYYDGKYKLDRHPKP